MINSIKIKTIFLNSGMLTNIIVRGLNLFSKLFLSLFLAKFYKPDFLGNYTIFLTAVTISIYFIGFEYYSYSQREYLSNDKSKFAHFVKNQFIFHCIGYIFLLPFVILFAGSFIPLKYVFFFVIILILEHLNQELYRLLVVINRTTVATLNNFLRSGIWIIIFILTVYSKPHLGTLGFLYLCWLLGEFACLLFSFYFFRGLGWNKVLREGINWQWIKNGVKISSVFFVSGMILKIIEYSERFFLQKIIDTNIVGVYFFYYNIAYLPYTFFTTVLVINYLPKIINAYKTEKMGLYLDIQREFKSTTKYFILGFYSITVLSYIIIVNFFLIDNIYLNNKSIFWGLLLASLITIISEIKYIELYIRHKDNLILRSYLLTMVIHVTANYILINSFGLNGAVIAKIFVVLFMLGCRTYFIKNYLSDNK